MEQQQFVNDNVNRNMEETNYNFEEKQYLQNYHDMNMDYERMLVIINKQNVLKLTKYLLFEKVMENIIIY